MSPPIRAALREETQPQVVDRVSAVLLISGVALLCAAPVNSDLPIWPRLVAARVAGAGVQLLAAVVLRAARRASWRRAMATAVSAFATAILSALAIALVADDPLLILLVVALTVIGTAIVLPWEVRPQLALGSLATLAWLPFAGTQSANVTVGVLSAFAASIYLAVLLDRQRYAQKAGQLLRAGHERAMQLIASDAEPRTVLVALLEILAEQAPNLRCAAYLADRERTRLQPTAWQPALDGYVAALGARPVNERADPYAAAVARGATIAIDDLARDPLAAAVRDAARSAGLSGCRCEPLCDGSGGVLGVLAGHSRAGRQPTARERQLLTGAVRVAVIALARGAARDEIARHIAAL